MKQKHLIRHAMTGVVFGTILVVACKPLTTTDFTLYLRCGGNNPGILTVAQETQPGTFRNTQQIDLSVACRAGKVNISGYQPEIKLRFILLEDYTKKAEVNAEYGRDIQRDEEGFYAVLKIGETPPYLTNDRI
jgi:methionyl-tRNA formyltransferase